MSEAKHTEGEWRVLETVPDRSIDYVGETFIKASNGATLATLSNYNPAERRANARLFAAAPLLLAALVALRRAELEDMDSDENIFELRRQAEDAINKATGAA